MSSSALVNVAVFVAAVFYIAVSSILVEDASAVKDEKAARWGAVNVSAAVVALVLSLAGVARTFGFGFLVDSPLAKSLVALLLAVFYLATSSKAVSLNNAHPKSKSRSNWLKLNTGVATGLTALMLVRVSREVRAA